MNDETRLDQAIAVIDAGDAELRAFYLRFLATELFVLLAEGATQALRRFDTADGTFLIAFDREERLADFAGPSNYAVMSGRQLAATMHGQGAGLILNPGQRHEYALPAGAIDWLADMSSTQAEAVTFQPEQIRPPSLISEAFVRALDERLASFAGQAETAFLVSAEADGDAFGLLALVDAQEPSFAGFAQMVSELNGLRVPETPEVHITFLPGDDPRLETLERQGLRFDLPKPPEVTTPAEPGSDPDKPPILR